MGQSYKTLLLETDQAGVGILTINRPDKLNALNEQVLSELEQVFAEIAEDDSVRGVIITGAGEKAFVAGADIKELSELDQPGGEEVSGRGQSIFQKIEDLNKPVIAAVNGFALGGGAELAMACHMRFASKNAVLGLPEVTLGLIPGYGGTQRLPQIVGRAKATELILTGNHIKAEEALRLGLLNGVGDSALELAKEVMTTILKRGPVAVTKALQAIRVSGTSSGFKKEANLFGDLCATDDFKEGTAAFLEKRKPDFSGK